MVFFAKFQEKNVESTLLKRVVDLEIEVKALKGMIKSQDIEIDDMRNKVLRKIQSKRIKEEQTDEVDEEGFLKTS